MLDPWEKRFERIRMLGWLALISLPCLLAAMLTANFLRTFFGVAAFLFIAPAFIYTYVVIIWHWKDRYQGNHSHLWGALILIETSEWMKIVYFFRHILPDMRHTGRYRFLLAPTGTVGMYTYPDSAQINERNGEGL